MKRASIALCIALTPLACSSQDGPTAAVPQHSPSTANAEPIGGNLSNETGGALYMKTCAALNQSFSAMAELNGSELTEDEKLAWITEISGDLDDPANLEGLNVADQITYKRALNDAIAGRC